MIQHEQQEDMQQDMQLEEDSLASSESVQAASEVTCTDYLKQLEEENAGHDDSEVFAQYSAGTSQRNELTAAAAPYFPNRNMYPDTYMWRVMHKRDRAADSSNSGADYLPANATAYLRNWNLMQSYFHWDITLPAAKKARITELPEINLNYNPYPVAEAEKEIHVIEEQLNVLAYPHQWYKGEASNSNNDASDPKEKGKGIANDP